MANTTEAYCVGRGRVTIGMIREWIQSGVMTKRQVHEQLQFLCLGERCTAELVAELGSREWNFREHPKHKHTELCPYRIDYRVRACGRLKKERVFDAHRLIGKHIVDISHLFVPPHGKASKTTVDTNDRVSGKPRTSGKPHFRQRIIGTRTQPNDLDELALFLQSLQLCGESWDKRYLHGLPGTHAGVPLQAAIFTSETSIENLQKAIGHERFIFGRVVRASIWKAKDPKYEDEAHLVLEGSPSSDVELNLLLPLEFFDTIKPNHVVLVRGVLKWQTPRTNKFFFTRIHVGMVAMCRYPGRDGHKLRSREEAEIDDVLFTLKAKYGIEHEVPGRLSEKWSVRNCRQIFERFIPDWVLTIPGRERLPVVVEYYGFAQEGSWLPAQHYKKVREEKRAFYTKMEGYRYLELEPSTDIRAMLERELAPYIAEAQEPIHAPIPVPQPVQLPRLTPHLPASVRSSDAAVRIPIAPQIVGNQPTLASKAFAYIRKVLGWKP